MSSKGSVTLIFNNFIFNIEKFMPSLMTSNLLFSACSIERKKHINAGFLIHTEIWKQCWDRTQKRSNKTVGALSCCFYSVCPILALRLSLKGSVTPTSDNFILHIENLYGQRRGDIEQSTFKQWDFSSLAGAEACRSSDDDCPHVEN